MKVLLGIIFFHLLVIFRAKYAVHDSPPYFSTFILTVLLVAFVVTMLYNLEAPEL